MSKEILFRGKRVDNGEWVYGDLVSKKYILQGYRVEGGYVVPYNAFEVIPETVGQFTGLTDKNGKKIYECDIVKTKFGRLCVVEWRSTQYFCGVDFMVCVCNANNETKVPSRFDLYFPENLEIVGNIFDNKELLGE